MDSKQTDPIESIEFCTRNVSLEVELDCGLDVNLNDVEWFTLIGGTPRGKEKCGPRQGSKASRFMELCSWLGMKSYRSLTGFYTDAIQDTKIDDTRAEEVRRLNVALTDLTAQQANLRCEQDAAREDMKRMRYENDNIQCAMNSVLNESKMLREQVTKLQVDNGLLLDMLNTLREDLEENVRRARSESEMRHGAVRNVEMRLEEVEGKLRTGKCQPIGSMAPPPPPPPPPLPPPPLVATPGPRTADLVRRRSTAPVRRNASGKQLTITPQDIANVKLRKTKDNPIPVRPASHPAASAPVITREILLNRRASLQRRPASAARAASTQISDLEKCLLQDSALEPLSRRRIAAFRSSEDLRGAATRTPRSPYSSPRSPRSRSLHPALTPTNS